MKWDDPLPAKIVNAWQKWSESLSALKKLEIPRCTQPPDMIGCPVELNIFADASEYAHGAVAYLRYVALDRAMCSLVLAKSNLAPLRPTTIPRNELNCTLSAARLSRTLIDELRVDIARVIYWTDSTTVLRWIRMPKVRFTAYVGARIGEILELTDSSHWHYVPSALNPADEASRGIPPGKFTANHRWFQGPEFLSHIPDDWPLAPIDAVAETAENDPEIRASLDIFSTVIVGNSARI